MDPEAMSVKLFFLIFLIFFLSSLKTLALETSVSRANTKESDKIPGGRFKGELL